MGKKLKQIGWEPKTTLEESIGWQKNYEKIKASQQC